MIPLAAVVAVRPRRSPSNFRLWIPVPLVLVWLLALPFLVLALPIFFIACVTSHVNPFRALWILWQLLCALSTTRVSVEHRAASILVHIL